MLSWEPSAPSLQQGARSVRGLRLHKSPPAATGTASQAPLHQLGSSLAGSLSASSLQQRARGRTAAAQSKRPLSLGSPVQLMLQGSLNSLVPLLVQKQHSPVTPVQCRPPAPASRAISKTLGWQAGREVLLATCKSLPRSLSGPLHIRLRNRRGRLPIVGSWALHRACRRLLRVLCTSLPDRPRSRALSPLGGTRALPPACRSAMTTMSMMRS